MKHKLKFFILFAIMCGLFLNSCQEDNDAVMAATPAGIKMSKISYQELTALKPNAVNKLSKINFTAETGSTARFVYNAQYQFTVNTDEITLIETDKHHLLTFFILRDKPNGKLENLVLKSTPDNKYEAFIVEYTLSSNDYKLLESGQPIPDINNKSVIKYLRDIDGSIYARGPSIGLLWSCSYSVKEVLVGNHAQHSNGYTQQTALVYTLIGCSGLIVYSETEQFNYISEPSPIGFDSGTGGGSTPDISVGYGTTPPKLPSDIAIEDAMVIGNFNNYPMILAPKTNTYAIIGTFFNDYLQTFDEKIFWNNTFNRDIVDKIITFLQKTDDNMSEMERLQLAKKIVDLAMQNRPAALPIANYVSTYEMNAENEEFILNIIDMMEERENLVPEEVTALNITLAAQGSGYLEQSNAPEHFAAIAPYTQVNLYNSANWPAWQAYFTFQCIVIKGEHPDWSDNEIFLKASLEMVHLALDIIGLVPGVGEIADLTNGVIYAIQGDGVNASLSTAAAIPFVGWGATGVKFAKRTVTLFDGSYTTLKWVKNTQNFITFGNRGQLRKMLNLFPGDPRQAHHIIPWRECNHPAIQKAAGSTDAFHMNEAFNGVPLNTSVHSGSHHQYDNRVKELLDDIPEDATPQEAYDAVMEILHDIKTAIYNNPNTHINNLDF